MVPPAENGAFFITTNVLITPNQTQVKNINLLLIKKQQDGPSLESNFYLNVTLRYLGPWDLQTL